MRNTLFALTAALILMIPTFDAKAQNISIEGYGLISSDLEGAMPKGLWHKQPRSEILALMREMPAGGTLRSAQMIKRNMLLSTYDTGGIKNDIPPQSGNDLLTVRLQTLLESGFWEDALEMYTQSVRDPKENSALAQVGVMLIFNVKGLSTACLEQKALGSRYEGEVFWTRLKNVCDIELGSLKASTANFSDSEVLENIYGNDNYNILANDMSALSALTPLELAVLAHKKRIKYQILNFDVATPPSIIKTFLNDSTFPSAFKTQLENQAIRLGLLPESPISDVQKHRLESVHTLSQSELIPLISIKLRNGMEITEKELRKLKELADDHPENYFYIQIISEIQGTKLSPALSEEEINLGIEEKMKKNPKKVNLLKTILDKSHEFSNNPLNVYEKQISLTSDGGYVMPTGGLMTWLGKLHQHRYTGLSLLLILSNVENNASAFYTEDNSGNAEFNAIKSLSTVGLIDQSHQMVREELANLMGNI